tara:strand:+ start:1043 stop:1660 length:618 start_codon:yes stop_codon:yes gene_type:complete
MKSLAIVGAGGNGKVAADIAVTLGWTNIVFFDRAWPEKEKNGQWPIVGKDSEILNVFHNYDGVFVAIGENKKRFEFLNLLLREKAKIVNLIHPSATVSSTVKFGVGIVIMPGVVVNADVKLGSGVILNTNCSVDHDCLLDSNVHLSPGVNLAGNVSVGKNSWIGIGASVRENLFIGPDVIVGAGAVVVSDVNAKSKVIGIPAKPF